MGNQPERRGPDVDVQGPRHDMGKVKVRAYCASLGKAPEPKVD